MREMKNILSLFALLLTFVGCHKDDLPYTSGTEVTDGIKLEIDFSSDFGNKTVAVRSGGTIATDYEKKVGKSCVYVFEHPSDKVGDLTATIGNAKLLQFREIKTEETFVILDEDIANSSVIYGVSNITDDFIARSKETDGNRNYTLTFAGFKAMQRYSSSLEDNILKRGEYGVLPRHSTPITVASVTEENLSSISIDTDFSYARIDVMMTPGDDTVIGSIQGIDVPSGRIDDKGERVATSHIVMPKTNSNTGQFPDGIDANHLTKYVQGLYIYPTSADISDKKKPVYILIKAKHVASDDEADWRYYKLLFRYKKGISENYSYNVERAVRYLIKIGKLNSPGYADSAQALAAPPSNISYEIEVDDKTLNFASNGQYYIGTDRSIYVLPRYVNVDDVGKNTTGSKVEDLKYYNWTHVSGNTWQFNVIFNYNAGKDSGIQASSLTNKMISSENLELKKVKKGDLELNPAGKWKENFGEYNFTFEVKDINALADTIEFTVGDLSVKLDRMQYESQIVVDDSGMVNGWGEKTVNYTTPDKTDNWTAKVTFPSVDSEWSIDYGPIQEPVIGKNGTFSFKVKPQFPRADDHHLSGTLVLTSTTDANNVITVPIEFSSQHVLAQATDKASVDGHVYLTDANGKKMYVYDRNVGAPEISRTDPVAKYYANKADDTVSDVNDLWRGSFFNFVTTFKNYPASSNGVWRLPTHAELLLIEDEIKAVSPPTNSGINPRFYIKTSPPTGESKHIYTFFSLSGTGQSTAMFSQFWSTKTGTYENRDAAYVITVKNPVVVGFGWQHIPRTTCLVQTVVGNTISIRSDQTDNTQLILEDFGEDQLNTLTVTTDAPRFKATLVDGDDKFHSRAGIRKSGSNDLFVNQLTLKQHDKIEFKLTGGAFPRAESDDPKTTVKVTPLASTGDTGIDDPVDMDVTIDSKHILAAPNDGLYVRVDMGTYWIEIDDRNRGTPPKNSAPTAKYFSNVGGTTTNSEWKGSYTTWESESITNTFIADGYVATTFAWRIPTVEEFSKFTDYFSNYQRVGFIKERYYIRSKHPSRPDVYVYTFLPLAGSVADSDESGIYMSTHTHNGPAKGILLLSSNSSAILNRRQHIGISIRQVRTINKYPDGWILLEGDNMIDYARFTNETTGGRGSWTGKFYYTGDITSNITSGFPKWLKKLEPGVRSQDNSKFIKVTYAPTYSPVDLSSLIKPTYDKFEITISGKTYNLVYDNGYITNEIMKEKKFLQVKGLGQTSTGANPGTINNRNSWAPNGFHFARRGWNGHKNGVLNDNATKGIDPFEDNTLAHATDDVVGKLYLTTNVASGLKKNDFTFNTGKDNTKYLAELSSPYSPIAKYCENTGADYYVPAISEFLWIFHHARSYLGPSYNYTEKGSNHWSSSDSGSPTEALYLYSGSHGHVNDLPKDAHMHTRCIRNL